MGGHQMIRVLLLAAALGGCTASTYTVDGAALADAQGRAERYCRSQDATAELTGTREQDGAALSVYRCVPKAEAHGALAALPVQTAQ